MISTNSSIEAHNDSTTTSASTIIDDDDYVSDDGNEDDFEGEDMNRSPSKISTDGEEEQILETLQQVHGVIARCRKLIKCMRNISIIDQFIRSHPEGHKNGFLLDIRVSIFQNQELSDIRSVRLKFYEFMLRAMLLI